MNQDRTARLLSRFPTPDRIFADHNTPHKSIGASLKYDTHLDYFVADCPVDCHRGHLDVDGVRVKVLTMKEPPGATFAHLLEGLYTVPGEFIACLEWRRIANDRIRRDTHARRRHFFNKRVALVNYVSPDTRPEKMLVDQSASATVKQLGDALTELDVNGHFLANAPLRSSSSTGMRRRWNGWPLRPSKS